MEATEGQVTVKVDLAALPIFPEANQDWFDDAVWDAAAMFAEGGGISTFDPEFDRIFQTARGIAARLRDLSPVIAAISSSTLEEWVKAGALEFVVPETDEDSVRKATSDLEAMIVSQSVSACAAAVFVGLAYQTNLFVQVESPAIVEFPLTVRSH